MVFIKFNLYVDNLSQFYCNYSPILTAFDSESFGFVVKYFILHIIHSVLYTVPDFNWFRPKVQRSFHSSSRVQ